MKNNKEKVKRIDVVVPLILAFLLILSTFPDLKIIYSWMFRGFLFLFYGVWGMIRKGVNVKMSYMRNTSALAFSLMYLFTGILIIFLELTYW